MHKRSNFVHEREVRGLVRMNGAGGIGRNIDDDGGVHDADRRTRVRQGLQARCRCSNAGHRYCPLARRAELVSTARKGCRRRPIRLRDPGHSVRPSVR